MDPRTRRFALRYRRFLRLARWLSTLPAPARLPLARVLGRLASPYRLRAGRMIAAMRTALGLDARQARLAWRAWLENHGVFALSIYRYDSLDCGWLHDLIRVAQPEVLERIAAQGGLVMTCHGHHQNTVAARIGLACGNLSPLAASAGSSPLYPVLGAFIEGINRDSARWFGKGRYLFMDNLRELVRETRRALSEGGTVLTLCDAQGGDAAEAPSGRIFGRTITPPTGAVAIALRLKAPIYAAIMTPAETGLELHLRELDASGGVAQVLGRYFEFLEARLRPCPAAWEGWEWWDSLPAPPS